MDIRAIIMSGGRGKRFWPLSRVDRPKQFWQLYGDGTLFQQTFRRLRRFLEPESIYTVTRPGYEAMIMEQVPEFVPRNIIAEPRPRNTAGCIALGTVMVGGDDETIFMNLPADHYISHEPLFAETLERAAGVAYRNRVALTLGITPRYPHDGYAYILTKEPLGDPRSRRPWRWSGSTRSRRWRWPSRTCGRAGTTGTAASSSGAVT